MGGWSEFAAAWALFLATHAPPARPAARARLEAALGPRGYLVGYVAVSVAALAWLIGAAGRAPFVPLWDYAPWRAWAPPVLMAPACLLTAFGIAAPNPLSFGGARNAAFAPDRPGIAGAARHPLLWALALWSGAHLIANGDLAHAILFGGFLGFSLLGMRAIDARLRRRLGSAAWDRLAARSSGAPLAALLDGRWRPRDRPSGLRLAAAGALWAGLALAHPWIIGVPALPF